MLQTDTEPLLTSGLAARMAGVAVETIRLWEATGKLTAIRTATGQRLFTRQAVAEAIRARALRIKERSGR